ncbi:hypothetical protein O6H91_11G007400 [Diphasiastrum complanatum]|uniref:Uncharacterized protein n=1 Tax=Diphasiastrum complanatum TaxID=34168 RepID=A0ACC2C668_DIPCM|nr:hypothetical protein O6H91_11G007400 [Diphasiastrum complanatum]
MRLSCIVRLLACLFGRMSLLAMKVEVTESYVKSMRHLRIFLSDLWPLNP